MRYTPTQYAKTLYDLIEESPKKSKEIVRAFAAKLVANGALKDLRAIGAAFEREWYSRTGTTPVEVTTVEKGSMSKKELEKMLGKDIEFIEKTDPAVTAGARIKIGDYQIDNTLARRLSDLKNALAR